MPFVPLWYDLRLKLAVSSSRPVELLMTSFLLSSFLCARMHLPNYWRPRRPRRRWRLRWGAKSMRCIWFLQSIASSLLNPTLMWLIVAKVPLLMLTSRGMFQRMNTTHPLITRNVIPKTEMMHIESVHKFSLNCFPVFIFLIRSLACK